MIVIQELKIGERDVNPKRETRIDHSQGYDGQFVFEGAGYYDPMKRRAASGGFDGEVPMAEPLEGGIWLQVDCISIGAPKQQECQQRLTMVMNPYSCFLRPMTSGVP